MNSYFPTLDELFTDDEPTAAVADAEVDAEREQAAAELRYYLALSGNDSSALEQLHNARLSLLQRREQLKLLMPATPIDSTAWQSLAPGFNVSRLHQAAQEWRGYFSDKALLSRAFLQLRDDGLSMVQQLAGVPGVASPATRTLTLSLLDARGSTAIANELPGAMLIEANGDPDLPLILFVPGHAYEFQQLDSLDDLGLGIDELRGSKATLKFVAITSGQDIFQLSAKACLLDPLKLPLTDLPAVWHQAIDDALDRERETYASLISFGSLSVPVPVRQRERKVAEYLQKIETLIGEAEEQSAASTPYRNARQALAQAIAQNSQCIDSLAEQALPLPADFWTSNYEALVLQRQKALSEEVRMQRLEGAISDADAELILQQVIVPPEKDAEQVVLTLSLQTATHSAALQGALVFTTRAAPQQPSASNSALLFMPGVGGGLQKFASLDALKQALLFTLSCGLETPVWLLIAPADRLALSQGDLEILTMELATSAIRHSVQSQLTGAALASSAIDSGERFYAEVDSAALGATQKGHKQESHERLRNEWLQSLGLAANQARERAIDQFAGQRLSARLAAALPAWVLNASAEVRQQYAQRLAEYQAYATALEAHLDQQLPDFEAFAIARVEAQLLKDLGRKIASARVTVDLPKSATKNRDIDPQFGLPTHDSTWSLSVERVQLSLQALAINNFDPDDAETMARLADVQITAPQLDSTHLQALSGDYLLKLATTLDVTGAYRALLKQVFTAPAADNPAYNLRTEVLLKPYESAILLEGFAARQLKHLSAEGYRLLELAAKARSMDELRTAGIEMHWVVCNPGTSVQSERSSQIVDGACVIHQASSPRTLIYLPDAPQDCALIEASSLEEAKQRLIAQLNGKPALVKHISLLAGLGIEDAKLSLYINRALSNRFDGFIEFQPALHLRISAQQLHTREWRLNPAHLATARSNRDIRHANGLRAQRSFLLYSKAVLSFIPGLSVVFSTRDIWESSDAANRAYADGSQDKGLLAMVFVGLSLLDVLLTVIPGGALLGVMTKAMRAATRLRQVSRGLAALPKASSGSPVLVPFKGYQRPQSLSDALAQGGADLGTWRKDGELWIRRQGEVYQVYRRSGEQTLRLRKTATLGYEPPVRLENGDWVYHSDVGLKGGARSSIAETLMAKANPDPAFGRKQARELLDGFDFPPDRQQRLELDVAVYYQTHKATPTWADSYRRIKVELPASPQPGPSGVKRPRLDEPEVPTGASSGQATVGLSETGTLLHRGPDAWKNWGQPLPELTLLNQVTVQPPVYQVPGRHFESINIDGRFFEILPAGSERHPNMVLLRNPASLDGGLAELDETIALSRYSQPTVASYAEGQWAVNGPLFEKPIHQLVADARPGLTAATHHILAHRLFEMSELASFRLTSKRLITLKATLTAWRKGRVAPVPQPDDPLLMLGGIRPTGDGKPMVNLNIANSLQADGLQRLDFDITAHDLADAFIKAKGPYQRNSTLGKSALRDLMAKVMVANGYELVPGDLTRISELRVLLFRRPGQEQLYLMGCYRLFCSNRSINMVAHPTLFPGSNAWVDRALSTLADEGVKSMITSAREEGRLIRVVGGTNRWPPSSRMRQVFVARIADDV